MGVLADTVRMAASCYGDRPAMVMVGGATLTYAELDRRSDALAALLVDEHDVGVGDVVSLVLPSNLDYVVAYAACSKVGAAAAGVNPKLTPVERTRLVEVSGPKIVLTTTALGVDFAGGAPPMLVAPWPDPGPSSGPPRFAVAETDESGGAGDMDEAGNERVAAIVFTSGTTGLPKGAVFRDRHLRAIAELDAGDVLGRLERGEVAEPAAQLASTQFSHVGFMTKLVWYLAGGLTTHVLERWRADDVIDVVERERIAVIGAVAPQIALLLRSARLDAADLSCVRMLVVGGAPSPPTLVRDAIERLGVSYSVRYSSTESGGIGLSVDHDGNSVGNAVGDPALGSIGTARTGVEVRIESDGELCLRSPAVCDGYWRNSDATNETFVDGWLHTGDLAAFDEDGRVRLIGRRTDMYIRGGYNVSPAEVEAVLASHPDVADIAVAPRPDDVMGEIGVAVVVARIADAPPTLKELRDHGSTELAPWKLPEALVLVDSLPLTPMQKLDRVALARVARRHGDPSVAGGATDGQ